MTQDQMIVNYLEDLTGGAPSPNPEEEMAYAAAAAFVRMVDEVATVEDLLAYRAWMTYCRMRGDPEQSLVGAMGVSRQWGQRLGVA